MDYYKGKLVLITGGSSGIGLALAKQLAVLEASVWILARHQDQLEIALKEIESKRKNPDQKFGWIKADVSNEAEVNAELARFISSEGVPDVLINSAGVTRPGLFNELDTEIFRWCMDINYFGSLYTLKKIVPGMVARHSGQIINISSAAGYRGVYGYTAYCGSKFAIFGLTDTLRQELKEFGIRVSVVLPPDTNTPQLAGEEPYKPRLTKALTEDNGGIAQPEDVARDIINAAEKGKFIIITNFQTRLLYNLINVLTVFNLFNPFMDSLIESARKKVQKQSNQQINP
jgi:3-dehydrosphinganine reductase